MLLDGLFAWVLLPFAEILPLLAWAEKAGPARDFAAGPKPSPEGPVCWLLPAVGEGVGDGEEDSDGQIHYCFMFSPSQVSGVFCVWCGTADTTTR